MFSHYVRITSAVCAYGALIWIAGVLVYRVVMWGMN